MSDNAAAEALWIWMQDRQIIREEQVHEQIYFRRSFILDSIEGVTLRFKVSADSRYRLFVNGDSVSRGPAKGDNHTYYYEEVDCASLREGRNVIAAHVVHYDGREGPVSVWRANRGGFFLSGEVLDQNGKCVMTLHTDERWRCYQETAIAYDISVEDTAFVGGTERVEGSKLAHGWQSEEYEDSDWPYAIKISEPERPDIGHYSPWYLTPRPIPPLYERDCTFTWSIGAEDILKPITIGPKQHFRIELDAGEMTTGYPVLLLSGGKNASVKLLYAECYQQTDPATGALYKSIRDDSTGVLVGNSDLYIAGGSGSADQPERYEPFLFRTFRFISLEVETAEEALTIQSFYYKETGYPLEVKASFNSSDASLQPLWNISINTLKRCMHETYEDCPYFEQLQYAMDTRLQALFTYQLSGDDRLARKAIFDFHSSRLPNGMLQSRYPSMMQQVIPGFSLYWIMMVHDHYRYFGDLTLVRTYLPTIDGILEWFHQRVASDGMLEQMPAEYWSYVDWVDDWRELRGVPLASKEGSMVIYNLMYAASLKLAAELLDAVGRSGSSDEYRTRAATLIEAVNQTSYSEATGLYQDAPQVELYSQHAQIWAVLAGAVQDEAAKQLIERMLANHQLAKVSYAMSFFLFRAFEEIGSYDKAFALWDTWRDLAALGLTSWVEDPVSQRSDCHAWGAVPIYEFSAKILGVSPAAPGCTTIKVAPQPGELTHASGDVAMPLGVVHVAWEVSDGQLFNLTVSTLAKAQLEIILPDQSVHVHPGGAELHFSCQL